MSCGQDRGAQGGTSSLERDGTGRGEAAELRRLGPQGPRRDECLEVRLPPPACFSLLPAPALSPLPSTAAPPWRTRGGRTGSKPGARKGCGAAAWGSTCRGRLMAVSQRRWEAGVGGGSRQRPRAPPKPRGGDPGWDWHGPRVHLRFGLLCGAERNAHPAEGTLAGDIS